MFELLTSQCRTFLECMKARARVTSRATPRPRRYHPNTRPVAWAAAAVEEGGPAEVEGGPGGPPFAPALLPWSFASARHRSPRGMYSVTSMMRGPWWGGDESSSSWVGRGAVEEVGSRAAPRNCVDGGGEKKTFFFFFFFF